MLVDLVKTTTSDGMRLDAALHSPVKTPRADFRVDAVVCLHGVGGNFYGGSLFENITPPLLELGIAALWINTRGHDGLHSAVVAGQPCRQGAAYENVDQCRIDIAAWLELLVQRGYQRIGLLGHSLGAVKALYAQAYQPHSTVRAVVAISPPRLSYECFRNGERSDVFFETISTAERHVREGRGDTLVDASFPFPIVITASGYVEKYGRQERYNILRFANKLTCPILFTYGQLELEKGGVAFAGVPTALAALSPAGNPFEIVTIPGADHAYTGTYGDLSAEIVQWLKVPRNVKIM